MKISIIGAGRIGRIHALNIANHPQCTVEFVADVHQPAAESLAQKVSATTCDVSTAINSKEVDAVVICSSTDTHSQYCMEAADAGKAIFCEKPLDLDLERAIETNRYVREKGVALSLGFNRRFDPTFAALKKEIHTIGNVEQLTITSRDPSPPPYDYIKVSGGLFKDMMIHDFDMARWLLPEEPTRLMAFGSALIDPQIGELGDIDSAMVMLETASGMQCQIVNSRRAEYGYDQRVELFGSSGLLKANNQHITSLQKETEKGSSTAPINHFFLDRYENAYINEVNCFVDTVMGKDVAMPDGMDGIRALQLAEAAAESLRTGTVVKLNFG